MNMLEHANERTATWNRRRDNDRRLGARRSTSVEESMALPAKIERRAGERRCADRRLTLALVCPDCGGPMRAEAGLSWYLPGTYTVDAGFCPSCVRRFLRDRETGEYNALLW
jgi:hypothetical protein